VIPITTNVRTEAPEAQESPFIDYQKARSKLCKLSGGKSFSSSGILPEVPSPLFSEVQSEI